MSDTFQHVQLRPEDLKGLPPEFVPLRLRVMKLLDKLIASALDSQKALWSVQAGPVISKWKALVEQDPTQAAIVLARAAESTRKVLLRSGANEIDANADVLFDCMSPSTPEEKASQKWPLLASFYPDLSHWVLAPLAPNCTENFSELLKEHTRSQQDMYKLLAKHASLVHLGGDKSLLFSVGDRVVRAGSFMGSAARILAVSTFLSFIVSALKNPPVCSCCQKENLDLKRCSRCRCCSYCNQECQKKHYSVEHKKQCKHLREIYQRYEKRPFPAGRVENPLGDARVNLFLFLESFVCANLVKTPVMAGLKNFLSQEMEKNPIPSPF